MLVKILLYLQILYFLAVVDASDKLKNNEMTAESVRNGQNSGNNIDGSGQGDHQTSDDESGEF